MHNHIYVLNQLWPGKTQHVISSALEYARQLGRTKLIPMLDPSAPSPPRHFAEPIPDNVTDMFERATEPLLYYAESVRVLRVDLVHQLEIISNNFPTHLECFKFDPQLAGSMAETTKLFKPDEFDFMCMLNRNRCLSLAASKESPNHCHILYKMTDGHIVYGLCQPDNIRVFSPPALHLDAAPFNRAFCDALEQVVTLKNGENIILDCFDKVHFHLEKNHKFPRLFLTRRGGTFDKLSISIDLVPCLRFDYLNDGQSVTPCLNRDNGQLYIVPKAPFDSDNSLPISYNAFEQSVFTGEPAFVRDGYILAKTLRCKAFCPNISFPTGTSLAEKLGDPQSLDSEEIITSYMLKSCAISCLFEDSIVPDLLRDGSQLAHINLALAIYERLQTSLVAGKLRPYYLTEGEDYTCLFMCLHELNKPYDQQLACCQIRHLRLAMCNNIINYLSHQKTMLPRGDTSVADIDCLYARIDVINETWWGFKQSHEQASAITDRTVIAFEGGDQRSRFAQSVHDNAAKLKYSIFGLLVRQFPRNNAYYGTMYFAISCVANIVPYWLLYFITKKLGNHMFTSPVDFMLFWTLCTLVIPLFIWGFIHGKTHLLLRYSQSKMYGQRFYIWATVYASWAAWGVCFMLGFSWSLFLSENSLACNFAIFPCILLAYLFSLITSILVIWGLIYFRFRF